MLAPRIKTNRFTSLLFLGDSPAAQSKGPNRNPVDRAPAAGTATACRAWWADLLELSQLENSPAPVMSGATRWLDLAETGCGGLGRPCAPWRAARRTAQLSRATFQPPLGDSVRPAPGLLKLLDNAVR